MMVKIKCTLPVRMKDVLLSYCKPNSVVAIELSYAIVTPRVREREGGAERERERT